VLTLPTVVFLSYWWLVPESVRWLIAKERTIDDSFEAQQCPGYPYKDVIVYTEITYILIE
jgi:hypothetical protein